MNELRVNLNSFNIFGGIPTAEKTAILTTGAVFFANKVITNATGIDLSSVLYIGCAAYYIINKYNQDVAVENYYKEIKRANHDTKTMHNIYRNSENVQIMGGFKAINNACALRVFNQIK